MSDWIRSTCMRCAVGCGQLQRSVDTGYGLDTVRGDPDHPVSRGQACRRGIDETANPGGEWLTHPQVRVDGQLQKTTWDVAISRVVEEFTEAMGESRDSVAVMGSGQQTNEAAYALGKLARGGIGTTYYDANTTLCMASAVNAYYDAFGSDAPPCSYDDIPEAESHVVWGANPAAAHPVLFGWIAESAAGDDSELIVVDPVESETASAADHHVDLDLGGDLDLARAVLAHVVETGAVDEPFVAASTTGFEELCAGLPEVATAAEAAGVDVETVELLADALDHDTLIYWGMGVNQSVQGTDTAGALIDLCLATGNMGPGSGPFSLTGQANSMGTRVCSSKGSWPGQREFDGQAHRELVAETWDVPVERLPEDTGPGPVGTFEAVTDGPIEAMYAVATNPVAGSPDASAVADALDEVFLVVQDSHWTQTTEYADVVLPAATWGESEGTAINMERTVSRVRAATDTQLGVRTDLDLITTIANGLVDGLFEATEPEPIFDEFVALTEGTKADCSGLSYDRLERDVAVRWPAPDEETSTAYRYLDDGEWEFETPSGLARFAGGTGRELPEPTDGEYPLTLTTAREADGYNTGVRSHDAPDDLDPLVARVHPETADDHLDASAAGGEVRIESRRGAVTASLQPDEAIPEGAVWLPIHHPDVNDLTIPATDPQSAEPNLKQCAVRLATARAVAPVAGGETV